MPECHVIKMGLQLECDKPLHRRVWEGGQNGHFFHYVHFLHNLEWNRIINVVPLVKKVNFKIVLLLKYTKF